MQIHGGGYTFSSKIGHPTPGFDPSGLLTYAKQLHDGKEREEGIIFVLVNYRLGALGFLANPNDTSLTPNAGLLDQRLALEWVQSYIYLFGGDPDRVTLMGESAGGGSIIFHISSYAAELALAEQQGKKSKRAAFKQVILQSPAAMPASTPPRDAYPEFLSFMNVSSLEEARRLDSQPIILANQEQIRTGKGTSYVHGPVIDNNTVMGSLGELFKPQSPVAKNLRNSGIKVLLGHNSFEGGLFFDPAVRTEADFEQWLRSSIAGLGEKQVGELIKVVYPPVFDGSYGYTGQASRQMALWGEGVLDCNFFWMGEAMGGGDIFACERFSIFLPVSFLWSFVVPKPIWYYCSCHFFPSPRCHYPHPANMYMFAYR